MKYNSAPIREAIFDLRIDNLENNSIEGLENFHEQIQKRYPNKKKQISFVGEIEFKEVGKVKRESDSHMKGFIFSTKDNDCQVQIRLDGFTFNKLKPYSDWKEFSSEALRLWSIYQQTFKPKNVTRIALRYINKIEIPVPLENFQDYIINMPPIPSNLPQTFRSFFMQIQIPVSQDGTNVVLTETMEVPSEKSLPFILDIDVFKSGNINQNLKSLKNEFGALRELKNSTFENCITDKTRNLFS